MSLETCQPSRPAWLLLVRRIIYRSSGIQFLDFFFDELVHKLSCEYISFSDFINWYIRIMY